MRKPIIAVTMGDPGGIGPEIILKSIGSLRLKARFVMVGKPEVFEKVNQLLAKPIAYETVSNISHLKQSKSRVVLLDLVNVPPRFVVGKVSRVNGRLAYLALQTGALLAVKGLVSALVTAPLSKAAVRKHIKGFTDQTDFLCDLTKTKQYAMTFVKDRSCVALVTTHLPLNKVAGNLNKRGIVQKAKLTAGFLRRIKKIRNPKIGVLGLNPHAGEDGTLGVEETNTILPAVRDLRRSGMNVFGPLPADSAFYKWNKGELDAVLAMYHDQGLGPFKMLHFEDGVHVTLGLPFVRTSPDHGTAFDIAYRGIASPNAMREAIKAAIKFSRTV
ncbi:MAG: 4-hydroxythreonine-4-phosphate dehydrogenase PdxA [Candidatus Omnitrophica bacterium]|nr:4-hydroxythreonine-4-phosphate dehydrogenase PdxA [Candidatus Omnitrophota bacterium]